MIKYVVSTDYSIVGWVEVTKPFDYAQGNAQQAQETCVGFRYRSTQSTILITGLCILCYKSQRLNQSSL